MSGSTHTCQHRRRKERQAEAIERQAKRDALTPADQIATLLTRPGDSWREKERLSA